MIAVEPQSLLCRALRQMFRGADHVEILNQGVGQQLETLPLFLCSDNQVSSFKADFLPVVKQYKLPNIENIGEEQVQITTLDALIETYGPPDFCKIDTEGFEPMVLAGLSTSIQALSIEFHNWTPEMRGESLACLDKLETLGSYRFNYSLGNNYHFELADWIDADALRQIICNELHQQLKGDIFAVLQPA